MVKFLKINGKDHPVRISYYALKMLKEKTGKSLEQMSDTDFETYEVLLYFSLEKGAQKQGIPFTFTMEDMEDVMDQVFFDFMRMVPEFFPNVDPAVIGKDGQKGAGKEKGGK
jgi:hypothetical protein